MAHSLVLGMTESGKTTLCKWVCESLKTKKITTAVLDPLNSDGWECDFQTSDSDEFLRWCKSNKQAVLFIDEGGTAIGRYNSEMEWLATQSRHWGHSCFFISQRATQMASVIRHQASKAYIFACGENDSKMFAEEWREPELKNLERIDKGEFLVVSRFAAMQYGRLDFERRRVYLGSSRPSGLAEPSPSGVSANANKRTGPPKHTSKKLADSDGGSGTVRSVGDSVDENSASRI